MNINKTKLKVFIKPINTSYEGIRFIQLETQVDNVDDGYECSDKLVTLGVSKPLV